MPSLVLKPTHKPVTIAVPRSGITSDLNRLDDPEYIACLLGQAIIVSLETVRGLPVLKNRARMDCICPTHYASMRLRTD